jgi:hypothetical protein
LQDKTKPAIHSHVCTAATAPTPAVFCFTKNDGEPLGQMSSSYANVPEHMQLAGTAYARVATCLTGSCIVWQVGAAAYAYLQHIPYAAVLQQWRQQLLLPAVQQHVVLGSAA